MIFLCHGAGSVITTLASEASSSVVGKELFVMDKPDKSRRRLLKGRLLPVVLRLLQPVTRPLIKMAKGLKGTSGEKPKDRIHGNSLEPEYSIDTATGE